MVICKSTVNCRYRFFFLFSNVIYSTNQTIWWICAHFRFDNELLIPEQTVVEIPFLPVVFSVDYLLQSSLLELGGKLSVKEAVKRSFSAVNDGENTQRKKKCNKIIGFLFLFYNCQSRTKFPHFCLIKINNNFRFFCL